MLRRLNHWHGDRLAMQQEFKRVLHAPRSSRIQTRAASLALGLAIVALFVRTSVVATPAEPKRPNPVALGEKIFADASLSASGAMACATCHDPEHAHAQSNDLSVQLGGPSLDVPGFRAVPSLQYITLTP